MDYDTLCYWVSEREEIRRRKLRGMTRLTRDPILQTYRFCNVRREDDRVTQWIEENVRKPFAECDHLWLMLAICRQINWPDTLGYCIHQGAWPTTAKFHPSYLAECLSERKAAGLKVYTGAYMIAAPPSGDKQTYIAEVVIGGLWQRRGEFEDYFFRRPIREARRTLEGGLGQPQLMSEVHGMLMKTNGWGKFMAYQAVVDMRFTHLLNQASDRYSWAAAGPGTLRGLNRLFGRDKAARLSQEQALVELRQVHRRVTTSTGIDLDFSDTPNIMCEYDKYLRVKLGEGKPRALYVPGRGS